MPSLLAASAQEGVRLVALSYLDQAASAATRLHDPADAEALHDFRVGMRRLRSWLRSYGDVAGESVGDKGERRLSRIASATNEGRDAEVQLAWLEKLSPQLPARHRSGVRFLSDGLSQRRDRAYHDVRDDLYARFVKLDARLREGLSTYEVTMHVGKRVHEPRFASVSARAIAAEIDALSKDLVRVKSPEDERLAHRARIHGKRLRYLLEPLRGELEGAKEGVKLLRALQDLLGDLHDLHNLAVHVGQAVEEAAVEQAKQLREAQGEGDAAAEVARVLSADERPGLVGVLRRVSNDRAKLFERLRNEWLAPSGLLEKLQQDVRSMIELLGEHEKRDVEIERKYLLRGLPPMCEGREAVRLDQGYVPGTRLIERIRRKRIGGKESYVRTVKLGEGIARIEIEEPCTKEVFEQLWSLTKGRRVKKHRFAIPAGSLVWEIDVFDDRPLFLAEVELPAADTEVILPDWLAPYVEREVTDDPAYVNANLAK